MFIGVNDHSAQRVEDLLSDGVEVALFCQRLPIALLPQVVDGLVKHDRRAPLPEDVRDVDALFIQTGDPVADRAWQQMAQDHGVQMVLVEGHLREASQPETFRFGPLALIIHPMQPLRLLRRQWRLIQRRWRRVRASGSRRVTQEAAGSGLDA